MFLIAKNELMVLKKVLMAVFSLIHYKPELDKYTEDDSSVILLTEEEVSVVFSDDLNRACGCFQRDYPYEDTQGRHAR